MCFLFKKICHDPAWNSRRERNEKGSGSETETEDLHTTHSHEFHEDREGTPSVQISLDELLTEWVLRRSWHVDRSALSTFPTEEEGGEEGVRGSPRIITPSALTADNGLFVWQADKL